MNIVGTTITAVIFHRSIAARNASASNLGRTTAVPPSDWIADVIPIGALWYSGAGER